MIYSQVENKKKSKLPFYSRGNIIFKNIAD